MNQKLVQVLDNLLATGNWETSLFLRTTAKQIQQLRAEAQQLLTEVMTMTGTHKQSIDAADRPGHVKLYISLYQADGNNLQKWQTTLKALADYSVGRPIYKQEEHVKANIRAKNDMTREGYVVVWVSETDIIKLSNSQTATDRFGNPLITLKMGAVRLENILEFVHCQQRYQVYEGNLVLSEDLVR
ncbi:MAG: Dot/Icm secretion system protein IcmQ [Coxiellaceae bacterium]|nr:MAG: Dot/Icm secretion system protein IcmQ [Coxiellaceae bacterium]